MITTNGLDNSKNIPDKDGNYNKGSNAIKLVSDYFKKTTGSTFKKAFSTVEEDFKRCIPKQLSYFNKIYFDTEMRASSIDGCSQYPANMCGRLPDAHTAKKVKGTVAPTEEYPFAFYIKSGHIAEYNNFDTHDWLIDNLKLLKILFRITPFVVKNKQRINNWPIRLIEDDEDETILMKASKYELTNTYQHFYNIKETYDHDSEEYDEAKMVMNASIGQFHKVDYAEYKYAHLVAVAIARANNKMLEKVKVIGLENIIQICVDGILYVGDELGVNQKQLGVFKQEFTNCRMKISNYNKYIVLYNDGTIAKFKRGNCNKTVDGKDITEDEVKDLDSQYNWISVDPLKEIRENYGN